MVRSPKYRAGRRRGLRGAPVPVRVERRLSDPGWLLPLLRWWGSGPPVIWLVASPPPFDGDGLLVDTEAGWTRAGTAILAEHGQGAVPGGKDRHPAFSGPGARNLVKRFELPWLST